MPGSIVTQNGQEELKQLALGVFCFDFYIRSYLVSNHVSTPLPIHYQTKQKRRVFFASEFWFLKVPT